MCYCFLSTQIVDYHMIIVHSHHPVRKGWCEVDVCSPIIELSFTPHYEAMIQTVSWPLLLDLQILDLAVNKAEIAVRVHSVIDKFAERGLRSLAVARQASALDAPFLF